MDSSLKHDNGESSKQALQATLKNPLLQLGRII